MKRERARLFLTLLFAGLFIVPLLMENAPSQAAMPLTQVSCAGHPRNAEGFVTDGTPQCGPQWCVGPNPGHFACLVAIYPDLVAFLNAQWAATHPVQTASLAYTQAGGARNGREACILQRENGGDFGRSSNPDHFGAFQFSRSTWEAHGGNPNTWGSASASEQWQVFYNTVAANGYSDWAPYDGC